MGPAFGASQPVLRVGQLGQPVGQPRWCVIAGGLGWPDPVPVPGAEVFVVRERPQHPAACVAGGAPGAGRLGEVVQPPPVRCRHLQLWQGAG